MPDLFGNSKLRDELDAWQGFIAALSPDDRAALEKAIGNAATQYGDLFVETAPRGHETEALLLSILISQQKKIEELKQSAWQKQKNRRRDAKSSA